MQPGCDSEIALIPNTALRHLQRSPLILDIKDRRPALSADLASTQDFVVTIRGHAVPNYELSRAIIYCCNFSSERVWYTIVPDVRAVLDAASVCQAQRANATHVLAVPIEALDERECRHDPRPVFVFSVGHCGATLLSRLLQATGRCLVSEPDIFTQLAVLRPHERRIIGATGARALIRGGANCFARLCGQGTFIKLRHHCHGLWPQIGLAIPEARMVFMLRDRTSWARSRHRVFGDGPKIMATLLRDAIVSLDSMVKAGMNPRIVWYEDLVADPLSTLRRLDVESDGRGALNQAALAAALQRYSQEEAQLAHSQVIPSESEDNCLRAFNTLWRQQGVDDIVRRLDLARLA